MPAARISRNLPERTRAPLQEGQSAAKHLAMIRLLPCAICGQEPCGIAHHLLKPEPGVRGQKRAADRWAIGLCVAHHDANYPDSIHKHGGEESWFALHFIDGRGLAKGLWAARGDLGKMRGIVELYRRGAAMKKAQHERPGL